MKCFASWGGVGSLPLVGILKFEPNRADLYKTSAVVSNEELVFQQLLHNLRLHVHTHQHPHTQTLEGKHTPTHTHITHEHVQVHT